MALCVRGEQPGLFTRNWLGLRRAEECNVCFYQPFSKFENMYPFGPEMGEEMKCRFKIHMTQNFESIYQFGKKDRLWFLKASYGRTLTTVVNNMEPAYRDAKICIHIIYVLLTQIPSLNMSLPKITSFQFFKSREVDDQITNISIEHSGSSALVLISHISIHLS